MHAIRFGWRFGLLLALPLLFAVSGCDEDDSEEEGDAIGMMAVDVEVCIAPGESGGESELSEAIEHVEADLSTPAESGGSDD